MSDTASRRPRGLKTIRDFVRFAVSRFAEAGVAFGQGASDPIDEAVYLVLETLRLPIDRLEPFLDARLTPAERKRVADAIAARTDDRRPAAYVTGRAYLQGIPLAVDPRVIVPRSPIAEILAGAPGTTAIGDLLERPDRVRRVLDLCTGSGALAIVAALRFPDATVDATELSPDALDVARANVAANGLEDRLSVFAGDLFAPLPRRRYDLIIANPPYVDAEGMAALPPEFRHEPEMALAGGPDGLDLVRRILAGAPNRLTASGGLLCEVGRGRPLLEAARPDLPFLWLDTAETEGEIFWLPRAAFPEPAGGVADRPKARRSGADAAAGRPAAPDGPKSDA